MNNTIIKIKHSLIYAIFLFMMLSCGTIGTILEPEGDVVAKPMIDKIEQYKNNSGHYPKSLMKLIPEYMARYNFQAFHYEYNTARGKKLDGFVKKGLILKGQGEGYVLTVRFHKYTGECTYVNGVRQSCRYIGR